MYYLQSRYYNPEIGRFINADAFASTGQGLLGYNMFAYCGNNPVHYRDPSGNAFIEALIITIGAEWTLTILVFGTVVVCNLTFQLIQELEDWLSKLTYQPAIQISYAEEEKQEESVPDVTYPGDDPQQAPEGYEWKGTGEQGSKDGNYYKKDTHESLHPDLDHPDPIGPHWDYNYRGSGCSGWRVFPDGRVVAKIVGGIVIMALEWMED